MLQVASDHGSRPGTSCSHEGQRAQLDVPLRHLWALGGARVTDERSLTLEHPGPLPRAGLFIDGVPMTEVRPANSRRIIVQPAGLVAPSGELAAEISITGSNGQRDTSEARKLGTLLDVSQA